MIVTNGTKANFRQTQAASDCKQTELPSRKAHHPHTMIAQAASDT